MIYQKQEITNKCYVLLHDNSTGAPTTSGLDELKIYTTTLSSSEINPLIILQLTVEQNHILTQQMMDLQNQIVIH